MDSAEPKLEAMTDHRQMPWSQERLSSVPNSGRRAHRRVALADGDRDTVELSPECLIVTMTRHRHLVISLARLTAIATSLLVLTVLIVGSSRAAFSDTTINTANSFATGTVVVTDDDTGSALFTATGMSPNNPVVNCITVTYSGSLVPADLRMYGTSAGALAALLDVTLEVGTGGSFDSCAGFTPTATIYTGTLSTFSTTHTNWATGLATFTAPANPTSRTLRFTVDVQDVPAAQGQTASADFTFEVQE